MGYTHVVIEIDCSILYHALIDCEDGSSYFMSIVSDCKRLPSSFVSCLFSLVAREANIAAPCLARAATQNITSKVCFDAPPSCIACYLD